MILKQAEESRVGKGEFYFLLSSKEVWQPFYLNQEGHDQGYFYLLRVRLSLSTHHQKYMHKLSNNVLTSRELKEEKARGKTLADRTMLTELW